MILETDGTKSSQVCNTLDTLNNTHTIVMQLARDPEAPGNLRKVDLLVVELFCLSSVLLTARSVIFSLHINLLLPNEEMRNLLIKRKIVQLGEPFA